MLSLAEKIAELEAEGYAHAPARAKLAHDIVLKAMEKCGFADSGASVNWMNESPRKVVAKILAFLDSMESP